VSASSARGARSSRTTFSPDDSVTDAYRLRPWTDVVRPHDDVASGDLAMGTYAANLAAAALGGRGPEVYVESQAFFESTFFTDTMRELVTDVFSSLEGSAGDRVVQLRTPFGGGKTHTLLALYHLATGRKETAASPELHDVPDPGPVRVAILSGEYLDPQRGREVEGRTLSTLWGELAYQLGGKQAYEEMLVDGDEGGPPGGEQLGRLLGEEPTLILLDEVLIYIAKGKGVKRLDTTVEKQAMLFLQNLTEAVNQRKHSAMVYSLQASVGEAVGEEDLLGRLEKIAGRIDRRREPVTGDEVLRVVQRRLFADLGDESVPREVANAYADQLRGHLEAVAETDGDREDAAARADDLERRILESYPFHPELIDLMNHRWGSLPMYQRTRGALQFLATVVHALWAARGDREVQALIGPGDVDLGDEGTRASLLEQVGETDQYTAVLEADFNSGDAGTKAIDTRIGRDSPALERLRVGTRVATAIMLLSFGTKQGEERGAFDREIIEASLIPGLDGNNVREALRDMEKEALLYLHHRNGRYHFDTVPNVNKLIRTERDARSATEVLEQVRAGLEQTLGSGASTEAVVWPDDPSQVDDRGLGFRIVYLPPGWSEAAQPLSSFVTDHKGGPRSYRNALAFALPSSASFDSARSAARQQLAVESLLGRKSKLNLSGEQRDELRERQRATTSELAAALGQAYEKVAVPQGVGEGNRVDFDELDLGTVLGAGRTLHERVRDALDAAVFDSLEPSRVALIAKLGENDFAWCEELAGRAYRFFELPKLWSPNAFKVGIAKGVAAGVFGYVRGVREEGGELVVDAPSAVRIREPVAEAEIDLGPGTALLSLGLAERLTAPSADPANPGVSESVHPAGGGADLGGFAKVGTPAPAAAVRITLRAGPGDVHALGRALSGLRDLVKDGTLSIEVGVFADSGGEPIDKVQFANKVREPLEESPSLSFTEDWEGAGEP
jgi:hypothetical protein